MKTCHVLKADVPVQLKLSNSSNRLSALSVPSLSCDLRHVTKKWTSAKAVGTLKGNSLGFCYVKTSCILRNSSAHMFKGSVLPISDILNKDGVIRQQ